MTTFEKAMDRLNQRDRKLRQHLKKRGTLRKAMGGKSSLEEAVNVYEKR